MIKHRRRPAAGRSRAQPSALTCALALALALATQALSLPTDAVSLPDFQSAVLSAKAQVATAVSTGAPVVLQLGFGTFLVTEPLIVNLVNATRPVTVTIWGQGAANTVLDCGGRQLAALQVFNASSTHLQDIGFQNCGENNPAIGGGGAYLQATGNILVLGCTFSGNRHGNFTESIGSGLNIEMPVYAPSTPITVQIQNCTFRNNVAKWGPAIGLFQVVADIEITSCVFQGNAAFNHGGAIYADGVLGSLKISDSRFVSNACSLNGGGLSFLNGRSRLAIANTVFTNNTAFQYGGGLAAGLNTGAITLTNNTFTANQAVFGGGYFEISASALVTVTACTFQNNIANRSGAGVYREESRGPFTMVGCSFSSNRALLAGGGIYSYNITASLQMTDTVFQDNSASDLAGAWGMELYNQTLVATNVTVQRNRAAFGAGLAFSDCGTNYTFTNCRFVANSASQFGGGVYLQRQNGTVLFDKTVTDGNNANQAGGGVFAIDSTAVMTLKDSSFVNNLAAANCSAIMNRRGTQPVVVTNTVFNSNAGQLSPDANECIVLAGVVPSPVQVFRPPPPPTTGPSPSLTPIPSQTPFPQTPSPSPQPQSKSAPIGAIVGGAVGGAVLLALIALLAVVLVKKKKQRKNDQSAKSREAPGELVKSPSEALPIAVKSPQGSMPSPALSPQAVQPRLHEDTTSVAMLEVAVPEGDKQVATQGTLGSHGSQEVGSTGVRGLSQNLGPLRMSSDAFSPGSVSVTSQATSYATADSSALVKREMLNQLQMSWSAIKLGRVLGQGGFGVVYQAKWQGNSVAVKVFENISAATREDFQREALAMSMLRHPCIAHVYGLVDDGPNCALVMKYYKGGTVSALINRAEYAEVPLAGRLRMAMQVASGMSTLHDRKMIHGDLKCSNLLIDNDGRSVVITDFGLSVMTGEAVRSGALTVQISPPEVLLDPRAPRTDSGDVYAFGIVLLEIMTGRPAYPGMNRDMVRRFVLEGRRPSIPDRIPQDIHDLITSCWAEDPQARPTFHSVVSTLETVMVAENLARSQRFAQHVGDEYNTTGLESTTTFQTTSAWPSAR